MPVTALSARSGRYVSHAVGPGRVASIRRPPEEDRRAPEEETPALTVTFSIPLSNDGLTPQAHRLIQAVRELVEMSQDTNVELAAPHTMASVVEEVPIEPLGPEVRLQLASRQVLLDGELLPLTRLEFDLLLYLAQHPRRVFTRGQLLTGVWGYEHTGERTVDVHVRRLRVKLGGHLPLITTVYGVGYRLSDDARVLVQPHD